jgi:predicted ester cyclase
MSHPESASTITQNQAPADDPRAMCARSVQIMADGDLREFEAVIHPEAVNREAVHEPAAARGNGPAAFYATALWLRGAFSDLRWDVHEVVADEDVVAVHSTMSGRHTGQFAQYDDAGAVSQVMPPTGRPFSSTQTHWFRLADGKIIEHWANRDDLATARQAGWVPPSPRYLVRMALAKRRARTARVAGDGGAGEP